MEYLPDIKNRITASILKNSDKGFVNDRGCIIVCTEMMSILQVARVNISQRRIFDIYLIVMIEAVKLFFHADGSSGTISEVIQKCIKGIGKICREADDFSKKYYFDNIIKSVQISEFSDWPDYGYKLLRNVVCLVNNNKQAYRVYDVFSVLGKMFDGKDYPDKFVITYGILERIDGEEVAQKYLMDNIHIAELRMLAVDKLLDQKNYALAEQLCTDALRKVRCRHINRPTVWAYYLERIYTDTANKERLIEIYYHILLHGDLSYVKKLKELYKKEEECC